jgi:hypothetical protein
MKACLEEAGYSVAKNALDAKGYGSYVVRNRLYVNAWKVSGLPAGGRMKLVEFHGRRVQAMALPEAPRTTDFVFMDEAERLRINDGTKPQFEA